MKNNIIDAIADLNALISDSSQWFWDNGTKYLDPYAPIEEVPMFALMGDRKALPRKGIITFSAKPKQGKSNAIRALLLAVISGKQFDSLKPIGPPPQRVLVIDTEMNIYTLTGRTKTMLTQLGEMGVKDAERKYRVISTIQQRIKKADRMEFIQEQVSLCRPDIVVIDQAAMLVKDFNDSGENSEFREWVVSLADNCSVWVVIHQNKAKDDENMKGHTGSMLAEEAEENYSVSTKNGVTEVKPKDARNTYVDEASTGFTFTIGEDSRIISAYDITQRNREKAVAECREKFTRAFGDFVELSREDLKTRYAVQEAISKETANKRITEAAQDYKVIEKAGEGQKAKWRLANAANDFKGVEVEASTIFPQQEDEGL